MSKVIRNSPSWKSNTISALCDLSSGLWKGKKPPYQTVGVIRNTNFNADGTLNDVDIAYLDVEVRQFATRALRFGDTVLEKSGGGPKQPVGRVIQFDKPEGEYSFSNFTACVRSKNSEILSSDYLHRYLHWLHASRVTEKIQSHSTGIRNLNLTAYKALTISYPSINEQRRIVTILDEAFEGIASAETTANKNKANAFELFESRVSEIFTARGDGWQQQKLEEICQDITVGLVGSMSKEYQADGVPFLRSQNVRPFHISLENVVYINEAFNNSLKKSQLRPGDLAIVRTGYPGTAAVIPTDLPLSNCSDLVIVRPGPRLNPYYMAHFFNSTHGKRLVLGNIVGSAQKHFNIGSAKNVSVPVPSLTQQERVVAMLDEFRQETQRLETAQTQKLQSLETLKQSLLHQAFSGNL
jgi:type I restriction enzyme S subunit